LQDPHTPWRRRVLRNLLLVPVLPALALLCLSGAPAGAKPLGTLQPPRAWEGPILKGIEVQDGERKSMRESALVNKYKREAARRSNDTAVEVRRLYLLARAQGLAFASYSQKAAAARVASDRDQLEKDARKAHGEAMATYQRVVRLAPDCYYAYHDMGVIELQQEKANKRVAAGYLLQARRIHPRYPDPLRPLTLVYSEAGQWSEVVRLLTQLLGLEPEDLVARSNLAQAYAKLNRHQDAQREARDLRRRDPSNPGWRVLEAQLMFEAGQVDEAQKSFRALADEMPTQPAPLQGYLRCIEWKRKRGDPVDPRDLIFALEGLLRLEPDKARRAKLREQMESIKRQMAQQAKPQSGSGKPPTLEEVATLLEHPKAEVRQKVMKYIYGVGERPPPVLLKAVMGRLDHKVETDESVRAMAVDVAGRYMGFGWLSVLRLIPAQDPSRAVRLAAFDALVRMSEPRETGRSAGVLILERFLGDPDPHVAATARLGIAQLSKARLRLENDATEAAHAEAFRKWWGGPEGTAVKIEALNTYHRVKDAYVEEILLPWLDDEDFFIRRAAWEGFGNVAAYLETADGQAWYRRHRKGADAFIAWVKRRPTSPTGEMTPENEATLKDAMRRWRETRPR
jgi:tetratricopeptide (TPR) repeat protein